jgi:hypothetical protein
VKSGGRDVAEGKQRGVVGGINAVRTAARARDDDEGAVRLRYSHRLALAAVGARRAERATVLAPALDAVPTGRTRVV